MWSLLVLGCSFVHFIYADRMYPYKHGTICNVEMFYNKDYKLVVNNYFCVPDSSCIKGIIRGPLMDYDGCNSFMYRYQDEALTCCHPEEIRKDWHLHYDKQTYIPGLKSFMMCKHYSHAICGPNGSYCSLDATEARDLKGIPNEISRYPHTALIGYHDFTMKIWVWFCLGSIVSEKYILTVWSCASNEGKPATNVKIGESRHCHLDYCPDKLEERNLLIINKLRQDPSLQTNPLHDLVLFEVDTITFNKNVRPACIYYQLNTRQSQGWFVRYGKPAGRLMKTDPRRFVRPIFMRTKDENATAFKVKTAGEARVIFSKTGLPYRKEFYYEIAIGAFNNAESRISRSDGYNNAIPTNPIATTPDILSPKQFRGFWVRFQPNKITVGKEDSDEPFLVYTDANTEHNVSAMGIYTMFSRGEWIVQDDLASMSLHEFELEVTYTDDCKEALGNLTGQEDEEIMDASVFCARRVKQENEEMKLGPCSDDWGGAVQIMDDKLLCMWQIFGVLMRESIGQCSVVDKPSLFMSLNRLKVVEWLEGTLYPDFIFDNTNLKTPKCVKW